MNNQLLWPMVIQILLTLLVFIPLGKRKKAAVNTGKADLSRTALDNRAWPDDVVQVSNNIQNQFQLPVLFYALCLGFMVNNSVSLLVIGLAWVFSVTRIAHAYVHITSNYIPHRMGLFLIGFISLLAMTVILIVQLALR
jgi:hypothetical protein